MKISLLVVVGAVQHLGFYVTCFRSRRTRPDAIAQLQIESCKNDNGHPSTLGPGDAWEHVLQIINKNNDITPENITNYAFVAKFKAQAPIYIYSLDTYSTALPPLQHSHSTVLHGDSNTPPALHRNSGAPPARDSRSRPVQHSNGNIAANIKTYMTAGYIQPQPVQEPIMLLRSPDYMGSTGCLEEVAVVGTAVAAKGALQVVTLQRQGTVPLWAEEQPNPPSDVPILFTRHITCSAAPQL